MENIFDNIFTWILNNKSMAGYDLAASGMDAQIFIKSGIDFSREEFQRESGKIEENFYETVADIYGVDRDEVVSTNGGSEAIQIASLFLSRESERIVIPVPEYEPMYLVPERYGFRSTRIRLESEYELKRNESLSFTDPNNPTGALLSRKEFFKSALENNPVFCDETFSEFTFPHKPFTNFTEYPNAITSFTLTKFYGAGFLRVGFMFASKDKISKLKEYRRLSSGSANLISLYLGKKILERREYFAREIKKVMDANRKILREKLSSFGLTFSDPNNSSTTLVSGDFDEKWCKDLMETKGVLVTPGKYFGLEKGFRICFTSTSPEKLSEGLDLIGEFAGAN